VRFLRGEEIDGRLWDVTVALGGELLAQAGLAADPEAGAEQMRTAFQSGAAAERFSRMVAALGGPTDFIETAGDHLRRSPVLAEAPAPRAGFVSAIDTRAIGVAVVELGGGRRRAEDLIDHAVGFEALVGLGAHVEAGDPLALVHADDRAAFDRAAARLTAAYRITDAPPLATPLILERVA